MGAEPDHDHWTDMDEKFYGEALAKSPMPLNEVLTPHDDEGVAHLDPVIVTSTGDWRYRIQALLYHFDLSGLKGIKATTKANVAIEYGIPGAEVTGFSLHTPVDRAEIDPVYHAHIPEGRSIVHVDWIFVRPKEQGKKTGSRLWQAVLDQTGGAVLIGKIVDQTGKIPHLAQKAGGIQVANQKWMVDRMQK